MAKSEQYAGRQILDRDGQSLGTAERVFTDDKTGSPTWISARVGGREYLMPLAGSRQDGKAVRLQHSTATVTGSPHLAVDRHVDAADVARLQRYYESAAAGRTSSTSGTQSTGTGSGRSAAADSAMAGTAGRGGTGEAAMAGTAGTAAAGTAMGGRSSAAGRSDEAWSGSSGTGGTARGEAEHTVPSEMHRDATLEVVRHEERIHVAKENREAGRVKLRMYVEQTPFEEKVQLSHETFEVQRVPITDTAALAAAEPDWREQVQELVLFGEQAHAAKDVVAVERVVVSKKMVAEEQTIRDTIRREQVEVVEVGMDSSAERGAARGTEASAGGRRMAPPSTR
jgi:stress response protein YsnF